MTPLPNADEILAQWKKTLKSKHTLRTYSQAIACLENFSQKPLVNISEADVFAFAEFMNHAKTPSATFNVRLAAIHNYYNFLSRNSISSTPKTSCVKLMQKTVSCQKVTLSSGQCRSLLGVIPRSLQGLRDFALLLGILCVHDVPPSVWCALSWDDFQRLGAIPVPVQEAVMGFVAASGRLNTIPSTQAIFIRLADTAGRFDHMKGNSPRHDHLSARQLHSLIVKYSGRVGLGGTVNARLLHQAGKNLHAQAISDLSFYQQLGLHNSFLRRKFIG